MAKKTTSETALSTSMLAFSRSLEISEAIMSGLGRNEDGKDIVKPVEIRTKGVRGQTSHGSPKADDFNAGKSNPQHVDFAMLPDGCDRLEIAFSMTVMPNSLRPSGTDDSRIAENFQRLTELYANLEGYKTLALRYLGNIASGRFAWRNRELSRPQGAIVRVQIEDETRQIEFDPFALDLDEVPSREDLVSAVLSNTMAKDASQSVDMLIDEIAYGLTIAPAPISVSWIGALPQWAEVYPSQEYVREESKKKDVAKVLSSVTRLVGGERIRCATMHSQKIGAALRAIDDWHGNDLYGPVPVNPYAGVQEVSIALRHGAGSANSFYDIAKAPKAMWDSLAEGVLTDDTHFFVANLVRGGVFVAKAA